MTYAHPDETDIDKQKILLDNGVRYMNLTVSNYSQIRSNMLTLISEWQDNEKEVKNKTEAALTKGSIAIVTAVTAVVSGGSLAPAAYLGSLALYNGLQAGSIDSSKYVEGMGKLLSLMDSALNDVNTAYSMGGDIVVPSTDMDGNVLKNSDGTTITWNVNVKGYNNNYKSYMSAGASHLNMSVDTLYTTVQKNAGSVDSHNFVVKKTYMHYPDENVSTEYHDWKTFGLPNDYKCKGTCDDGFRSPHEALTAHQEKCGTAEKWYKQEYWDLPLLEASITSAQAILDNRGYDKGCGKTYYNCPSNPNKYEIDQHEVRTCNLWVWIKPSFTSKAEKNYVCKRNFRKCMNRKFDHNPDKIGKAKHSDEGDGEIEVDVEPPEKEVKTQQEEKDVLYACGIHSGLAADESSDHKTRIDGWAGKFNECQPHETFGCGHIDLSVNSDKHSLETCPKEDNIDCNIGSYYKCKPHTHDYPKKVIICGAKSWTGCVIDVSSRTDHQVVCVAGHSYWSCNPSAVAWHFVPIGCKRDGCNLSVTKCQNRGGGGCFSNGKEYKYHKLN